VNLRHEQTTWLWRTLIDDRLDEGLELPQRPLRVHTALLHDAVASMDRSHQGSSNAVVDTAASSTQ
jgi:hypothetical protein